MTVNTEGGQLCPRRLRLQCGMTSQTSATACLGLLVVAAACRQNTSEDKTLTYPSTKKGDVVDDYHGTKVADPYRWMEDLESKDVADWVAAENTVTEAHLASLELRQHFKDRITALWNYPKTGLP